MSSNSSLEGKIAFITGSTRGIGWSTAKLFAEHGATVLLNGVSNRTALTDRVDELRKTYGVEAEGFLCDVSRQDEVEKCYREIFTRYRRLDVLVNNAGILDDHLIGTIRAADVAKTFDVNVSGVIFNLQSAARLMMRKRSGSIVNVTSIMGRVGNAGQVVYAGSKASVLGITFSAAKELAPQGVRVNAVAPGFIETDLVAGLEAKIRDRRIAGIAMGRPGRPEEVAEVIRFLASDDAAYVTGQVIGVDGGMVV